MEFPQPWVWQPNLCPADQDFIEWVRSNDDVGLTIFHMGTGSHHQVGDNLSRLNDVIGLTYSPEEMESYIYKVKEYPFLSQGYTLLFGDIYNIDLAILPRLHYITLFHLGEIYDPENTVRDSTQVIEQMQELLYPQGKIIYYKDSAAASTVLPLMDESLVLVEEFKSLRIYKPKE